MTDATIRALTQAIDRLPYRKRPALAEGDAHVTI